MTINVKNIVEPEITYPGATCSSCLAACCSLEVLIISDTGVPERHIDVDQYGGETMLRLDDGRCSALDRDTQMCTIYENRPWICREFEMGSYECKNQYNGRKQQ